MYLSTKMLLYNLLAKGIILLLFLMTGPFLLKHFALKNIDAELIDKRDQILSIISHEGIVCADGGRSSYCGMQVCSVMIYVRRGALLEVAVDDLMGSGVSVGEGEIPTIHSYGFEGRRGGGLRWNGQTFAPAN
jgi:hypothetical protein